MLRYLFTPMVVFAAFVSGIASSHAAEIRLDPSRANGGGAIFEGHIDVGDFDKVKQFLLDGPGITEIFLASPGGSLAEAMRIGRLVRFFRLLTVVPNKKLTNESREVSAAKHELKNPKINYTCASACFFVFVAGIYRRYDGPGPAILGIHRPSMSRSDYKKLGHEQVGEINERLRTAVDKYLNEMGVPSKYAAEMFSMPPNGMRWILDDDFAHDFAGYIPELKKRIDAICDKHTDTGQENSEKTDKTARDESAAKPVTTQFEERQSCERRIQVDLALRAHESARSLRDNLAH
jgi:hypothetical protein